MTHSPEPWTISKDESSLLSDRFRLHCMEYNCIQHSGSQVVCDMFSILGGYSNAERIVDCVNAMHGIQDPLAFMRQLHKSLKWLGRAEMNPSREKSSLCAELRTLGNMIEGGFEEYT